MLENCNLGGVVGGGIVRGVGQTFKIQSLGGGNSWKSGGKFPEKWSWGGGYN